MTKGHVREGGSAPLSGRGTRHREEELLDDPIRRLKRAAATVIEGLIDLLDQMEGERVEENAVLLLDLGAEEHEPRLATAEDGNTASRAWCVDGEVEESEEEGQWWVEPGAG